jgi:hypothetical protein
MRGLEPPRAFAHYHLKVACIPISPHPQDCAAIYYQPVKEPTYLICFCLKTQGIIGLLTRFLYTPGVNTPHVYSHNQRESASNAGL